MKNKLLNVAIIGFSVAVVVLLGTAAKKNIEPEEVASAGSCDYTKTAYPTNCAGNGTCLVPLTESTRANTYLTASGRTVNLGIYEDLTTTEIDAHEQEGSLIAAQNILPRNANGDVDLTSGKIGVIAIGFSNTTQTWNSALTKHEQNIAKTFVYKATRDSSINNSKIVFIDAGLGGCQLQCANGWATCASCGLNNSSYPTLQQYITRQVSRAGLTPAQVQIAWVKISNHYVASDRMEYMTDGFVKLLQDSKVTLPNLRVALMSSRIYGGYALKGDKEPYAYENGLAVREMIYSQVRGQMPRYAVTSGCPAGRNSSMLGCPFVPTWDTNSLCYEKADGTPSCGVGNTVKVPWVDWGVYAWANGTRERGAAPIEYSSRGGDALDALGVPLKFVADGAGGALVDDVSISDCQHPGSGGQDKHSNMLLHRFKAHPATYPWFCVSGAPCHVNP